MHDIVAVSLVLPLLIGLSALVRFRNARRLLVIGGLFIHLVVCLIAVVLVETGGPRVVYAGGHRAPYGIALVLDSLSAVMLLITAIIACAVVVFSRATIDANRERFAYYPLLALLVFGINFAFLTGDLFTLYVAFEVMLMASFVLLTLGGERGQLEGGLKYVTLNLLGSTLFLIGAALTYAVAGTLNMAQLAQRLADMPSPGITTVLAALFLVGFGIKAGIFPLFFWLPASYHTPPIAVTALFGALLTKVGIYAMWRVVGMIFPHDVITLQPVLLALAALTMITGVLGAIAQSEVRRLLSFHIISQIGYLLMGLALFTTASLAGAVFFMLHVILAKTTLFFVGGIMHEGTGTFRLKALGGLHKARPGLAVLFLIAALSLAGIPPLPGFWAKLALIQAGLDAGQYAMVAVAIGTSILTLFSMIKIWNEAFWKPAGTAPAPAAARGQARFWLYSPALALAVLMVLGGLMAEPLYRLSQRAAEGLVHADAYIALVLPEEAGE